MQVEANDKASKTHGMGENLQREWEDEPNAKALLDARDLLKIDPQNGLRELQRLAENGSSLGMFYLGEIYNFGRYGIKRDDEVARNWRNRSASLGSIEGAFALARQLELEASHEFAESEYRKLAERRFSPALFVLGLQHCHGGWLERDVEKAIDYLEQAEQLGHLWSTHLLCHKFRKEKLGLAKWTRGWAKWFTIVIPFVRCHVLYPNSDRLRR